MMAGKVLVGVVAAMVVVLRLCSSGAEAACNAGELAPCAAAFMGDAPSRACCKAMKAQEPCLCTYALDPYLHIIVDPPNSKKAMVSCKVPIPTCMVP